MKSLTWCSPVCSLDSCHLSGSKLPGWNTVYTDRRDYRALDREAIWTHWMGSSSMTLPWQLVDETNCDCSMISLTPQHRQSNTFIQDRTFKYSVYTLIFSWTLEPWGSLKNTHAIHRVVISTCWRTVNANYKLIHKPAVNVCYRQGQIHVDQLSMPPHRMKSDYDWMTQIQLVRLSEVRGAVKLMQ